MSHGAEIPVADEAQRKCYVIYTAPCDLSVSEPAPAVTLLESPLLLASAGTTGLRTWEAAKYLASFLYSDSGRTYVSSKAVIELGTGTGLVSLFCAKWLGARYVLATDGTGEVVDTLSANAFLNGLDGSSAFDTAVVKWGHALEGEMLKDEEGERSYSTIVGADVVSLISIPWLPNVLISIHRHLTIDPSFHLCPPSTSSSRNTQRSRRS